VKLIGLGCTQPRVNQLMEPLESAGREKHRYRLRWDRCGSTLLGAGRRATRRIRNTATRRRTKARVTCIVSLWLKRYRAMA
jgi:hypothetical protein